MRADHKLQRAQDAAFFEDWSDWASLDDLPEPDRPVGHFIQHPARHNRYRMTLRRRIDWLGGAAFEVALPPAAPIHQIVRRLPGAQQHPGLRGINRIAHQGLDNTWYIPAQHWRALRAALPQIKTMVLSWVQR